MKSKSTDELLKQLNSCNNIEEYFKENEAYLIDITVAQYLKDMFFKKHLVKSRVFRKAEIDEIYGYQIFSGRKNPSRNTLLALCIGAEFTFEETQTALKIAGFAPLYAKNKRDSIIIYSMNNGKTVCEINEILYEKGEKTLN